MTPKQFLIELTGEIFITRLEYFTQQDDSATVAALYSEWIVDGIDPENGEYEWIFIPNLVMPNEVQ